MLTDIFAERYANRHIWGVYGPAEKRLLVQTMALAKEVLPYRDMKGNAIDANVANWQALHDQLARELGVSWLANPSPNPYLPHSTFKSASQMWGDWDFVCEQFVLEVPVEGRVNVDTFIKERLSVVELVMRLRHREVSAANARFPKELVDAQLRDKRYTSPAYGISFAAVAQSLNDGINAVFARQSSELNERLRRAGAPLSYHNGIIQVSTDATFDAQVETPFWELLHHPRWTNVDIDMKEALDLRDAGAKDPAIHAAKALESTVKVISTEKGWNTGREKGAANFIDNLVSKANGAFLETWEGDLLKDYFRQVRNPLGHGAGAAPMPVMSSIQTDWAIETAMVWIRLLVRRL